MNTVRGGYYRGAGVLNNTDTHSYTSKGLLVKDCRYIHTPLFKKKIEKGSLEVNPILQLP